MDRETGKSRGFTYVIMGSIAEAEKMVGELNGTDVDGRVLRVNMDNVDA
jgi:cold-inducible RNA-binding protein